MFLRFLNVLVSRKTISLWPGETNVNSLTEMVKQEISVGQRRVSLREYIVGVKLVKVTCGNDVPVVAEAGVW